ncbi:MAG: hydroxymethylglutaryl-CoA synthase, partial [Saprospiraceae bacterium]
FQINQKLAARTEIDYPTYESLHRLQRKESVLLPSSAFRLDRIGAQEFREGARYYSWAAAAVVV